MPRRASPNRRRGVSAVWMYSIDRFMPHASRRIPVRHIVVRWRMTVPPISACSPCPGFCTRPAPAAGRTAQECGTGAGFSRRDWNARTSRLDHGRPGMEHMPRVNPEAARGFKARDCNCPGARHSLFPGRTRRGWQRPLHADGCAGKLLFQLRCLGLPGRCPKANPLMTHDPRLVVFVRYCAAHPPHCRRRHASNPPAGGHWARAAFLRGGRRQLPGRDRD